MSKCTVCKNESNLVASSVATKEELEKQQHDLKDHIMNDALINSCVQQRITSINTRVEIQETWTECYLSFSWFTKIFRKKYMKNEYLKIVAAIQEKYKRLLTEPNIPFIERRN